MTNRLSKVRTYGDYKKNVLAYEAANPWRRESLAISFKTLIQLYMFCLFIYFWVTVSMRVSKAISLDVKCKSVGLWGRYGLEQGNPLQNPKIANLIAFVLISDLLLYLMYQNGYQRIGVLRKKNWPMRQIQPETGESCVLFYKTPIQLYLLYYFFILWLTVSNSLLNVRYLAY